MKISVKDGERIVLNQSKSLMIRQLIAVYLYRHKILDIPHNVSRDVRIVHNCLYTIDQSSCLAQNIVDVQDCGAAYRFLTALLAITPGHWLLTGTERLLQRPIDPLIAALQIAGADIQRVDNGLAIVGKKLKATSLVIDCTMSSQFASALLLVAPLIQLYDLKIEPSTPPSANYIAMTQKVMGDVMNENPLETEGDWSSASFWYAFLAASPNYNSLLLMNLKLDSVQGDRVVSQWFDSLGVESIQCEDSVLIKKTKAAKISSLKLDFSQNIDLAPVMAVTAILLSLDLTMTGIENLNFKESARLINLKNILSSYIVVNQYDDNEITWCGARGILPHKSPVVCDTFDDHRLVQAFSLLSLIDNVYISNIQCVDKSYPQLLNYLEMGDS